MQMTGRTAGISLVLIGLALATACAPAASQTASSTSSQSGPARKQLVTSMFSMPAGLHQELTNPQGTSGSVPGLPDLYQMVAGGLTYLDADSARQPWLAEAVPSTENGFWIVS